MTNYNNGKIYKIEPICEHDEGDIYIGSTTKRLLSIRMAAHKYQYKKYKDGSFNSKVMSFDIFEKYGPDNVKITLIEFVNANSKDELLSREAYYIRNTNCINKQIPLRTKKQYRQDNKEKIKDIKKIYYKDNKDKIKEYYEDNKDKIKEYYENNKDKIKKYKEQNKDKIKEYQKLYREKQKLKKTIEI